MVAVVVFVVAVDKTNGWMATARALAHATAADARTGNNGVEPGTTPSPAWSRYASTAGEDGGWQTCSWLSSTVLPGLCGSAYGVRAQSSVETRSEQLNQKTAPRRCTAMCKHIKKRIAMAIKTWTINHDTS